MKLTIDMSKEVGSKVTALEVKKCDTKTKAKFDVYVKVADDKAYKVLAPDFLTDGGDEYEMIKKEYVRKSSDKDLNEILVEYIKSFDGAITEDHIPEHRITILDELVLYSKTTFLIHRE